MKLFLKLFFPTVLFLGYLAWGMYDYIIEKILINHGKEIEITVLHTEHIERKRVFRTSFPERCYVTYSYITNGVEHVKKEENANLKYCSRRFNSEVQHG